MDIPRFYCIRKCMEEIKKMDPNTSISCWLIRNLCKSGKIKHFGSGNKSLVNFDDLLCFFNERYLMEMDNEC